MSDYCYNCYKVTDTVCSKCELVFYCSPKCFEKMIENHKFICTNHCMMPELAVQRMEYMKHKFIYSEAANILEMLKQKNSRGIVLLLRSTAETLERSVSNTLLLTKSWLRTFKLTQAEKLYDLCTPGDAFLLMTVFTIDGKLWFRSDVIIAGYERPKFLFCACCKKMMEKYKLCSACKSSAYCSKECQISNWPQHKLMCGTHKEMYKTFNNRKVIKEN